MNVRDGKGKANIIIDEARAPLIRRLFEDYSSGLYTLGELLFRTKQWGLVNRTGLKKYLVKSHLYQIINNPFYYGEMCVKGQIYPHRYEPLISREVWEQCQAVLNGWNKKPFKWAGKDFVFRGLISCAVSGHTVTASTQKKTYDNGSVGSWTYLVAHDPEKPEKKVWVREERVIEQVHAVLAKLKIPQDQFDRVKEYIRQTDHVERDYIRRQTVELQKEQAQLKSRLDTLMDLLLDGSISREEHDEKRVALKGKLAKVSARMNENHNCDDNFKESLISLITLASNADALFAGSNNEEKRKILNCVFSNLMLKGATLCYELRKPFDMMVVCDDFAKWLGNMDSNHDKQSQSLLSYR